MAFILLKDLQSYPTKKPEDHEIIKKKWDEYFDYLKSVKNKIPKSVYAFATADWHYNAFDARCPHDAWLDECKFNEVSKVNDKFALKPVEIYLKLLGAYHNGYIELRYKNIHEYKFESKRNFLLANLKSGYHHQDWLRDEIRLSENDFIIHEIEWFNANWIIECKDIEYKWIPFEENQSNDMTPKI